MHYGLLNNEVLKYLKVTVRITVLLREEITITYIIMLYKKNSLFEIKKKKKPLLKCFINLR